MTDTAKIAQLEEALAGARREIAVAGEAAYAEGVTNTEARAGKRIAGLEMAVGVAAEEMAKMVSELAAFKSHDRCNAGMRSWIKTLEAENKGLRDFIKGIAGAPCMEQPGEFPEEGESGIAPCLTCQARAALTRPK